MLRPVAPALAAAVGSAALAAGPPPAAAKRIPCVAGQQRPLCHAWHGKVRLVADGDTIDVDVAGDRTRAARRVRLTGINAFELSRYSRRPKGRQGECHAVEAANRLHRLIRRARWRVRLTAQRPSSRSGTRLRRSVAVRDGGRWRDLGTRMIEEGHAWWLPGHPESHFNRRYAKLSQAAAYARRNIWDPAACGSGPAHDVPLRLWVNWDADSADGKNLADEWVRIKNQDPAQAITLGGWWVNDSDASRFRLPRGTSIPPGSALTVHVGAGRDRPGHVFAHRRSPVFENAGKRGGVGDGAYLVDPRGNIRAWMIYPCMVACADPLRGRVRLAVDFDGRPESLTVRNVSGDVVDLFGYVVRSYPRSYHFPAGSLLGPGQQLRVVVGREWAVRGPIFKNKGGSARLESYDLRVIDCVAWRAGRCERT